MTEWSGAVAVVTGASRGIGREVAREAARRGARVALVARSADDLERLAAELGVGHLAVPADVADRAQVGAMVEAVERELGAVDVLVNNAGVGAWGAVADTDTDVFERMLRVNYLSAVSCTKAVLPGMLDRGRGNVCFVASVAGRMAAPYEAAYSASKFAMIGFAEALAVEVAPRGVRVSIVDPGVVATGFFDARGHAYERTRPKPIPPARVARVVCDAVARDRQEVFVPGSLHAAYVMKTTFPPLYRWGVQRAAVGPKE